MGRAKKYSESAAPGNAEDEQQVYFILRALYEELNDATLKELAMLCGYNVSRARRRSKIWWDKMERWATRHREKANGPYVYSRIPGMNKNQVLREFREAYP